MRLGDELVEDLAGAAQQRIAAVVAPLVVRGLEAVEVGDDDGDGKRPFAFEAVELFRVEGAVVELGQDVVPAEKLEIGLGLLAGGDVGERDLDERPVALVPGQHRELQMQV